MEAVDFSPSELRNEWIDDFFQNEGMYRLYLGQLFKNGFLSIKDFAECIVDEIETQNSEKEAEVQLNGTPSTAMLTFDAGVLDMITVLAQKIRSEHLRNRYSNKARSCLDRLSEVVSVYIELEETSTIDGAVRSSATFWCFAGVF